MLAKHTLFWMAILAVPLIVVKEGYFAVGHNGDGSATGQMVNQLAQSGAQDIDKNRNEGDEDSLLWPTYAGSRRRLFFNSSERQITKANVSQLTIKWQFQAGAIVTASPIIVPIKLKGKTVPIALIQSWDNYLYALRVSDGAEVWRFKARKQPGASYPNVGSAHVARVDGKLRVFFPAGETLYALDPLSGKEIWRFHAGTGCAAPTPPGLCGFDGERNEIESSPIVVGDMVIFGMDVTDKVGGKGGVYAISARDGRLRWFFDLDSGQACHPFAKDRVRAFDGYHTEKQLGLPKEFLTTRPGCDFDRTPTGCSNVWSSPAIDDKRKLIFLASSNCYVDKDPNTPLPSPPSPPFNEAIFALGFDGTPAWRWRPRETCIGGGFNCFNQNLAFGAVPNLFSIKINGKTRDVVGVGNKDGTYYAIDRDGINRKSGVRWDDKDATKLPYWRRNVVPGGAIGGIIATAAVDEPKRRIYFSTAIGEGQGNLSMPQKPTMHAVSMDTGKILWQNKAETPIDPSYSPVSAIPGVAFTGSIFTGTLRAYNTDTGNLLARLPIAEPVSIPGTPDPIPTAIASGAVVYDGMVIVGAGVGSRSNDPGDRLADASSRIPQKITALCVPGTPACSQDGN